MKASTRLGQLALTLLILFFPVIYLNAQQGGGIVTGHVQDTSGAAINDAEVVLSNSATQQAITLKTNRDGEFVSPSLPIGTYSVKIIRVGFRSELREDVRVEVDVRLQVSFSLAVGGVDESINVSTESVQVNTASAELGTVFSQRPIQELPVNGRSVLALAQLTPGVTSNAGPTNRGFVDRGYFVSSISINNGPSAANAVLIDGQNNIQTYLGEVSINPAADAIQEFKVESGVIAPEYGYTAGGVINLVSAAGTQKFHGSAYDFIRNDLLDARNYFNRYPSPISKLRYNQFGGTFGGPLGKKNVFFANYEEYRYNAGTIVTASVPTAAWRQGDFTGLKGANGAAITIYDPTTTRLNAGGTAYIRDPYPGNIIPAAKLDPVAVAISQLYPLPNRAPDNANTQSNNYQGPSGNKRSMRQYLTRVDRSWSDKHTMFGRFAYFKHFTDTGGASIYSIIQPSLGLRYDNLSNFSGIFEDTYIFSPSLINEARVSMLGTYFTFETSSHNEGWPQRLGMPSSVPPDTFPRMSNGFPTSSTSAAGKRIARNPQFSDILSITHGKHSFRFGTDIRWNRGYNIQTAMPSGVYNFTAGLTTNPTSNANTGYAYASFMAGAVTTASFDTVLGANQRSTAIAFFFQDVWKLNDRLTLNLGLRYDRQDYPYELSNGQSNFLPEVKDPLGLNGRMVYAGVNGQPRSFRNTDNTNLAPRLGFAWNVFGDGNTSVRGGFAMYYANIFETDFFGSTQGFASTTTPYAQPGGNTNLPAFYLKNGLPFPVIQPLGAALGPDGFLGSTVTYDRQSDGKTPQSQQWVLSVQQTLPYRTVLDVAYTGNHGVHFASNSYSMNSLNPSLYSMGASLRDPVTNPNYAQIPAGSTLKTPTITRLQSLLPFPYYVDVQVRNPHNGNFIGHGLQASLRKQMTNGLTLVLGYTKSKLIDNSITTPLNANGVVATTVTGYQNVYGREAERAIDPLDRSQTLNISGVYDLPFGHGKAFLGNAGPFVNRLVGGFQFNTVTSFKTGTPLTISGANNRLATRPNFVPGVSPKLADPTISKWFNTAAFVNPSSDYTFGNVPRTLANVRGPGVISCDASVFKVTPIYGRLKLELRAEVFNVINHANFNLPNTSFTATSLGGPNQNGAFGSITSAADPRQVQLAAKLKF